MSADRNLLFGILALQMDFISRDALIAAMNAWVLDKAKPLGQVLVEQGALDADNHAWLEAGVERHLAKHGNDPERSLAALSSVGSVRRDLQQVADADVQASLAHVSAAQPASDPDATRADTASASARRFLILRPHAKGGLGEVFVARDEELRREVALKEIQECHADHPETRARFLLEAEITGGLEHPGIVPVYSLGHYGDGRPFYAMRFIRGDSLKEAIARFHEKKQSLTAGERALRLRGLLGRFVDVCQAIAYAHSRGVLHRDLKPGNVMLGKYGETLVVDWGLAKVTGQAEKEATDGLLVTSADAALTQAGRALGTPAYMSPEQAAGHLAQLGPRSDVYSLGASLYCLLTGQAPFPSGEAGEVLARVQRGDYPRPRELDGAIPPALEAVCLKAMALRPEDRYPSPQALAQDIERWLADEPVSAWREPLRVRVGRWARRHQTAVTATAAAVLVALLLGGAGAFVFERQWAERRAEQARQEALLRQGVEAALDEVTKLEGKGRWGEARAVLAQAASRLGEGGPPDLRVRVEHAGKDLDLVAGLNDIRLSRAAVVEGRMDSAGADRRYAAAFAEAGLAREGGDPAEAAGRVHASAVSGPLVAALDDWTYCAQDEGRRAWLLEVARKSDPNPWRDRARQPAIRRDREALQALLAEEEVAYQSSQLLATLGGILRNIGGNAAGFLRRAQVRHPDDFWLNFELGFVLGKSEPAEAAGYYRAALALRPDTAVVRSNLGGSLWMEGKLKEAEEEFRAAIRLDPDDARHHTGLGLVHSDRGEFQEAEKEFHIAMRLNPKDAFPHNNLGKLLYDGGKLQEAEEEVRTAIVLDPKFADPHNNLGNALRVQGKPHEAEAEYRLTIHLRPDFAHPHNGLGALFADQGKQPEAEAEFRLAIRLDPRFADPHTSLGTLLAKQGKSKEAEEEYRAAIRLDPGSAEPHTGLGIVLTGRNELQEAETEFRTGLRLKPENAILHNNLGMVLHRSGKPQEAEVEYRTAIRLEPKLPNTHSNLGIILKDRGQFDQAKKEYQQALDLGFPPAADGVRQCDRLIALATRLPAVLRGEDRPAGAQEMLAFADLCYQPFERRFRAAARFYSDAFAADPKLAGDLKAQHRYNAACNAALAGCGQGKDADTLDAKEKARLRRQALDWLAADLAAYTKRAQSHQTTDSALVQQRLQHWKEDSDLAGVRGDALAKLPEAERPPWKKLWDDVDALLAAVSTPQTKR